MESLDDIGIYFGTDKCSLGHDYLRHYEYAVAPFRDQTITLLEIGVLGGSSMKMWKKYMPNANIVGIDIAPVCRQYAEDRVKIEIGDQSNPVFLANLREFYVPSIIIDDGSHIANHIVASFEGLFPSLAAGGVYIIEDLQIHHPSRVEWDVNAANVPDYFLTLARNLTSLLPDGATIPALMYAHQNIDKMVFFPKALALWKKPTRESAKAKVDRLTELLNDTKASAAWTMLSLLAVSSDLLPAAERAAGKALRLNDRSPHAWSQMATVLQQTGQTEEAESAARTALSLANGGPAEAIMRSRLAALKLAVVPAADTSAK